MKKIENFENCLRVLKRADFEKAEDDEIYRTGIIGQFNITFEMAWKALQAVMRTHQITEAITGSPREILKQGFSYGFLGDEDIWILMLKKRNVTAHIYNEDEVNELLDMIRDSFIMAFGRLLISLKEKYKEVEGEY